MWLINVSNRRLEYFEGSKIPPYAILSHRWESEEVTFQEVRYGRGKSKKGYQKIELCCIQAAQQQNWYNKHTKQEGNALSYVWIDTCCIDKTNSAELSEAINSMYHWYRRASVCYAYLSDVKSAEPRSEFENSAWFTRGWTLQELLAPSTVYFYNCNWVSLGERKDLVNVIWKVTGIAIHAVNDFSPSISSAAEIMSWAAQRQTTREEDRAYSLLGLFDVNMPLIYGEGKRAFYRLQEEIWSVSQDVTIFAWTQAEDELSTTSGIFADSPSWFARSAPYIEWWSPKADPEADYGTLAGSIMTGKGLSVRLDLVPVYPTIFIAPLCFTGVSRSNRKLMGMLLRRWDDGLFSRHRGYDHGGLFDVPRVAGSWSPQSSNIILARGTLQIIPSWYHEKGQTYGFNVDTTLLNGSCDFFSKDEPYGIKHLAIPFGSSGITGMVRYRAQGPCPTFFVFGFNFDFSPFCLVIRPNDDRRQSWDPPDCLVSVWSLGFRDLVIGSSRDMLDLVLAMQGTRDKVWSVEQDGVELHLMSWKVRQALFRISSGEEISLSAAGSLIYAKITTGGQRYAGRTSSGVIDKWYHRPSDQT